jgi:hypothetical protein
VTCVLEDSSDNTWVCSVLMTDTVSSNSLASGAGYKATSAVLDRVRLTTVNGTDTFDAGAVSISYE